MPRSVSEASVPLPIRIMLVDRDVTFRLGLKTCLDSAPELQVVAEFGRASEVPGRLEALSGNGNTVPVDLLVWAIDVRQGAASSYLGLPQLLQSRYPTLPICVLLTHIDDQLLGDLWQLGVAGCWLKDASPMALVEAMCQMTLGQSVWDVRLLQRIPLSRADQSQRSAQRPAGILRQAWIRTGNRGLREINRELADLDQLLAGPGLGVWERLVLEGRFREMKAARWWMQQMLGTPPPVDRTAELWDWPTSRSGEPLTGAADLRGRESLQGEGIILPPQTMGNPESELDLSIDRMGEKRLISENQFQKTKNTLISNVVAKLTGALLNLTSEPLEVDILMLSKRQELLVIILRGIEEALEDLRYSQVTPEQLALQRSRILRELWQQAVADFYGKYAILPQGNAPLTRREQVPLVPQLLESLTQVEAVLLDRIPMVLELLAHLLFQVPLLVETRQLPMGSPEALAQAQALLENWILRLANAVVAPLLNQFGTSEYVKQNFFDPRWISTREIERFRNALAWKYRMQSLFTEPKYIFESQVPLLVLSESGIRDQDLYSPRDEELRQLRGVPLLVTLALEARDAIAPPLRATVTWVGRGVVYLLTQVVGRGIGLIGRGILQGVGTAWQETRDSRRSPGRHR
ncbi:DUF3685 domain-containing protein [Lyngbya confervoides]|uniref:DUF3685 domain-containing protein n=1 Tax=Lyngbya confervoides BDU141951 TaxID=1574623 RepID=A0ABD4T689_9CYAN|nr:DUF3685 domain-containing protein [Lyngbya confervoides]MCM1984257.1 DUF3685 domain-containing protein [Lyngbya confervoides BDU141951]